MKSLIQNSGSYIFCPIGTQVINGSSNILLMAELKKGHYNCIVYIWIAYIITVNATYIVRWVAVWHCDIDVFMLAATLVLF